MVQLVWWEGLRCVKSGLFHNGKLVVVSFRLYFRLDFSLFRHFVTRPVFMGGSTSHSDQRLTASGQVRRGNIMRGRATQPFHPLRLQTHFLVDHRLCGHGLRRDIPLQQHHRLHERHSGDHGGHHDGPTLGGFLSFSGRL